MKIFALIAVVLLVGCQEITAPKPDPIITLSHVKIVVADFDYHQTLEKADGTRFEFNHCSVNKDMFSKGAIIDLTYRGNYNELIAERDCAQIINIKFIVRHPGIHKILMTRSNPWSEEWLDAEGSKCGTVDKWEEDELPYQAYAFDDYSQVHEYKTLKEAENFITENWCQP